MLFHATQSYLWGNPCSGMGYQIGGWGMGYQIGPTPIPSKHLTPAPIWSTSPHLAHTHPIWSHSVYPLAPIWSLLLSGHTTIPLSGPCLATTPHLVPTPIWPTSQPLIWPHSCLAPMFISISSSMQKSFFHLTWKIYHNSCEANPVSFNEVLYESPKKRHVKS